MKIKITKFILFTLLFLLFLVGWVFQCIDFIGLATLNSNSYVGWGNIRIPYIIHYFFCTFLFFTTATAFLGYQAVRQSLTLYKEYKEKYADKIAAKKATRAEEAKQAKIKALEAELEELKND